MVFFEVWVEFGLKFYFSNLVSTVAREKFGWRLYYIISICSLAIFTRMVLLFLGSMAKERR